MARKDGEPNISGGESPLILAERASVIQEKILRGGVSFYA